VRSADGDENAGFADFEAAESMDDRDAVDSEFFVELRSNFAHFGECHGFVGFVVKVKCRAMVRLIADETVKCHDGAVTGGANVADESAYVDRLAHQLENVVLEGRGHGDGSAAAHGRKEGHFVAGAKRSVPGSKFLIAGSDHGRAVFCEFGNARRIESEEFLDGGGVGEIEELLGMAKDIFQAAKEQDLHADGL